MDNPLIVYHSVSRQLNCDDGYGAAFLFWLKYGYSADYMPGIYDERIPLAHFTNRDVIFADFCYDAHTMDQVSAYAKSLLVLDHHKTSDKAISDRPYAVINHSVSGAMLTWMHLYPDEPAPLLIHHISDNDTWQHKDPATKPFMERLRSLPYTFEDWQELNRQIGYDKTGSFYQQFVRDGMLLMEPRRARCKTLAEAAFPITLRGVQGLAINANKFFASDVGETLAMRCGTFGAVFFFKADNTVEFSLRSVKGNFDVEVIAESYGGGGHSSASGFSVPLPIFASIVDYDRRDIHLYMSIQKTLIEFCENLPAFECEWELAELILDAMRRPLGYLAEDLGIDIITEEPNSQRSWSTQMGLKIARWFKLPEQETVRKWYHAILPYTVVYEPQYDDDKIAAVLDMSRSVAPDNESAKEELVDTMLKSVNTRYRAELPVDHTVYRVSLAFANSSVTINHSIVR